MSRQAVAKKDCSVCPALCCKNLSVRILKPENQEEIDDLKWQLRFDTVSVYIRSNRWYQHVEGRCMYLDDNDLCTIYSDRPDTCRRHNPPECEFFGKFYDVMLTTPEELEAFIETKKEERRRKRKASRRTQKGSRRTQAVRR